MENEDCIGTLQVLSWSDELDGGVQLCIILCQYTKYDRGTERGDIRQHDRGGMWVM